MFEDLNIKRVHPTSFKLGILVELFESEVSASLSEPRMSRDYGLLTRGSVVASTNARLEYVMISAEPKSPEVEDDVGADCEDPNLLPIPNTYEPEIIRFLS